MSDHGDRPGDDITTSHPSARLRAAPSADDTGPAVLSGVFPGEADLPTGVVAFGPDIVDESALRLIGNVDGKRLLELGGGSGHNAVALAKQGAHVILVDPSHRRLERIRAAL